MPHGKVAWKRGVEIAAWPAKEERFGICMHVYVYVCMRIYERCLHACMHKFMYVYNI